MKHRIEKEGISQNYYRDVVPEKQNWRACDKIYNGFGGCLFVM